MGSMLRRSKSKTGCAALRNISAAAAVTLLSALFGAGLAAAQDGKAVDTALIVAVDVSNSVDDNRYRLQMEGIAQALHVAVGSHQDGGAVRKQTSVQLFGGNVLR